MWPPPPRSLKTLPLLLLWGDLSSPTCLTRLITWVSLPLHPSSAPPPLHPSSTSCPVRCSGRGGESCLCWTWHGTTPDGQETLVRTDGAVGVVTSCVTATSLNLPLNTFRWRTLKSCRYAEQRETAEFYVTDAEKRCLRVKVESEIDCFSSLMSYWTIKYPSPLTCICLVCLLTTCITIGTFHFLLSVLVLAPKIMYMLGF